MLLIAGILTILLGVIHTLLGEFLIFQKLRDGTLVPTGSHSELKERHVRIIWATWHFITILAFSIGAILCQLSTDDIVITENVRFIILSIAVSMLSGSLLILFATKGRHPAWIVLIIIAALSWMSL
ncbi:hypothetical protein AADZ91_09965 [Colwelliaceae bacterium 6441]